LHDKTITTLGEMRARSQPSPVEATGAQRPRLPLRAVNAVGALLRRAGMSYPGLDPDELVRVARRQSRLEDLGRDEYIEPLRVFTHALEHEANLNFVGRFSARSQIVTLLANRLHMQDWQTRHPEIGEVPIRAPWFVVGLPRTGTTLVQQLLASDPANRSLLFWEAIKPAPPPERARYTVDPRISAARRSQRLLDYVAPAANAIHPVGAELPTECVSLLAHSFASLEFGVINHVPSHVEWCLRTDLRPHYEAFRAQLQLLSWRCSADRWTLKSPAHLVALDALFDVFPDARLVWLHRDPVAAVTSHCSLVAVLQAIGCDRVDLSSIGRSWPATWGIAIDRALRTRDRVGEEPFLDVAYDDLIAHPIATMQRIYAHGGAELGTAVEQRMREHLSTNPRHGRGVHTYRPDDFALDATTERGRFAGYVTRFAIPVDPRVEG
jgi:hypothetical protein